MIEPTFVYRAKLVRVIDGDTIFVNIDLGFRMYSIQAIRLREINAPELNQEGGYASKNHLIKLLADTDTIILKTYKNPIDKYGRWLADVYVGDTNINHQMVLDKQAVFYD